MSRPKVGKCEGCDRIRPIRRVGVQDDCDVFRCGGCVPWGQGVAAVDHEVISADDEGLIADGGEVKRLRCRRSGRGCQTPWLDLLLGSESQLKGWEESERHSVPCPEARGRRTGVSFEKRTTRALGLHPRHTVEDTDDNYTVPTSALQECTDGARILHGDDVDDGGVNHRATNITIAESIPAVKENEEYITARRFQSLTSSCNFLTFGSIVTGSPWMPISVCSSRNVISETIYLVSNISRGDRID